MDNDIGRLTKADEQLNHQIADTFATVRESDRNWTEKVWLSMCKKDGSVQIDFGIGKYINRNVIDGFGGISRGKEQWTVRVSRALDANLEEAVLGPIRYEVIEPMNAVRCVLEPNKTQPIAFDVVFHAEMAPVFEGRNLLRTGYRIAKDVVRYHQVGAISGWLELDGVRQDVTRSEWFGMRDHSWGMRGDLVGEVAPDLEPNVAKPLKKAVLWGPWLMKRTDGSKYEIHHFIWHTDHWSFYSGAVIQEDGSQETILSITPNLEVDPRTREFIAGKFELRMATGDVRNVYVNALGDTGFSLRTGLYVGSWKGGAQGSWRGRYHEDGEYIANTSAMRSELGQFRDCPVLVREGDVTGYGIQESIFDGDWPEFGIVDDQRGRAG